MTKAERNREITIQEIIEEEAENNIRVLRSLLRAEKMTRNMARHNIKKLHGDRVI